MAKRKTKPKRRLVQGRDWHAWAWEHTGGDWSGSRLMHWAEPEKPKKGQPPTEQGRWVRVRFVPIDDLPALAERIAAMVVERTDSEAAMTDYLRDLILRELEKMP